MSTPSPTNPNTNLVSLNVLSNGKPIDTTYQIVQIDTNQEIDQISTAKITLLEGSPSKEDFTVSDSSTFDIGATIEIKAGYDNSNSRIFKGVIVKQGLQLSADQGSLLEVFCQNDTPLMVKETATPPTLSLTYGVDILDFNATVKGNTPLSDLQGSVSFQGSARVNSGDMIQLAGLGKRFNGNAFVLSVAHYIAHGNWRSKVGLGNREKISQPEADVSSDRPLLTAMSGLCTGIVKQIDQDPESQFRVLVNIPILDSEQQIWARLSNFYAGKNGGAFFYPEVGDEVALGFLNEDPKSPVILGSLYSKDLNPPPLAPDHENTNKAIISKSQLKVKFDDQNKVLQFETPQGNIITLSDQDEEIRIEDQNRNIIEMNSSGIDIVSNSDLNFKAFGSIRMTSDHGTTISSGSGVSVRGLDVSVSAEKRLNMNGGAQASLSGGGEVSISGGMVMIN